MLLFAPHHPTYARSACAKSNFCPVLGHSTSPWWSAAICCRAVRPYTKPLGSDNGTLSPSITVWDSLLSGPHHHRENRAPPPTCLRPDTNVPTHQTALCATARRQFRRDGGQHRVASRARRLLHPLLRRWAIRQRQVHRWHWPRLARPGSMDGMVRVVQSKGVQAPPNASRTVASARPTPPAPPGPAERSLPRTPVPAPLL